jgi:hypothetical protein
VNFNGNFPTVWVRHAIGVVSLIAALQVFMRVSDPAGCHNEAGLVDFLRGWRQELHGTRGRIERAGAK